MRNECASDFFYNRNPLYSNNTSYTQTVDESWFGKGKKREEKNIWVIWDGEDSLLIKNVRQRVHTHSTQTQCSHVQTPSLVHVHILRSVCIELSFWWNSLQFAASSSSLSLMYFSCTSRPSRRPVCVCMRGLSPLLQGHAVGYHYNTS